MRVGRAHHAVEVVIGPVKEEQEAALLGAGVVRELVEEFVQDREDGGQLGERFGQRLRVGAER